MASEWQGGSNFILIRRGSSMSRAGGTNEGKQKKKYGDAGMKNRVRFNPNPTRCSSTSCVISAVSKAAKAAYEYGSRPAKFHRSKVGVS